MNDLKNKKIVYPLLLLICLVFYLPGLVTLPPVDRDEARFAQASRQMLEDHDFVRIRFQDQPRHKKPVGIYWLQAGATALTGQRGSDAIWPYRLPSLAGAALAVLATCFFGRRLFSHQAALWGAVLIAGCLLLVVEAHLAKTDAMLLAAMTIAQGALGMVYTAAGARSQPHPAAAWTFWAALGAAMLLKGPIALMISGLTVFTLVIADRDARWLRHLKPLRGILLAAILVVPWLVSIHHATQGRFFTDAVGSDLLPKLFSGQESHGAPPGYYTLLLMATFWPGALFVWPALGRAWKHRNQANVRFCLAWIVPTWLALELIPTKLPHYVLPTYPALALLTAAAVEAVEAGAAVTMRSKAAKIGFGIWCVVTVALATALTLAPLAFGQPIHPLGWCVAAVAAGLFVYAIRAWRANALKRVLTAAVAVAALILAPALQTTLPGIDALWVSRQVAHTAARVSEEPSCAGVDVAASGYREPSLVFLCGTDTRLGALNAVVAAVSRSPRTIAVVREDQEPAFKKKTAGLKPPVKPVASVRGFNYSKGRWVTLKLYQRESSPQDGGGQGQPPP